MEQYAFFINRVDAGKRLASELSYLSGERLVVLAVLNGGISVGVELAKSFFCPLDIVSVHKLYLPSHPEVGFGAISMDGTVELNHEAIKALKLTKIKMEEIIEQMFEILKKRRERFTQNKPPENLRFRTVIIADDGLSSGYTMRAAIRTISKKMPKKIIVAIPTASDQGLEFIKRDAKEVVCLYNHPKHYRFKIEDSYQNWQKITDQEAETIFLNYSQGRHAQSSLS